MFVLSYLMNFSVICFKYQLFFLFLNVSYLLLLIFPTKSESLQVLEHAPAYLHSLH